MKTKTILMALGFALALGMLGYAWHQHTEIDQKKASEATRAVLDLRAAIEVDVNQTIGSAKNLLLVYDAGFFSPQTRALLPSRDEVQQLTEFPSIRDPKWETRYDEWKQEANAATSRIRVLSRGVAARIDAALPLLK